MQSDNPIEAFAQALRKTRILRARKNLLYTFGSTRLPYFFLAESSVNTGDVVLRRGEVTVERPRICAPHIPLELEGFDFGKLEKGMIPVLINRWVHFPVATYHNANLSLEVMDGPLDAASERVLKGLDRENDIRNGVVLGPEEAWGFSVLGYVGQMIARSAPSNIGEYFERFGLEGDG
ncbi:MAG: hypothetical protein V1918_09730 [Planctomycetota bacterium]